MFRNGANFTAAMTFQFASTNLVLELGILLAVLMGWQFTLAEFTGGPLMIAIMVVLFKAFLTPKIVEVTRQQADKGLQGRMKGHAAMDMSVHQCIFWQRMTSDKGRTAISHFFVMDWASLWLDIGGGLFNPGTPVTQAEIRTVLVEAGYRPGPIAIKQLPAPQAIETGSG